MFRFCLCFPGCLRTKAISLLGFNPNQFWRTTCAWYFWNLCCQYERVTNFSQTSVASISEQRYVCKHQNAQKFINFRVILFLSDINECEDKKQKYPRCPPDLECENTEGHYNCNKRKSPLKIAILGMSYCSLNLENEYCEK